MLGWPINSPNRNAKITNQVDFFIFPPVSLP
jgi:hypothetical protein